MDRRLLSAWCGASPDPLVRSLARAVLEGDAGALPCLWDRLQETGEPVMQSLKVGQAYLIRTEHGFYTGRVVSVTFTDVTLEEAAWIAYIGHLHETLRTGEPPVVDPLPRPVIVSTAAIVDAVPWEHELPREPKDQPGADIPF